RATPQADGGLKLKGEPLVADQVILVSRDQALCGVEFAFEVVNRDKPGTEITNELPGLGANFFRRHKPERVLQSQPFAIWREVVIHHRNVVVTDNPLICLRW